MLNLFVWYVFSRKRLLFTLLNGMLNMLSFSLYDLSVRILIKWNYLLSYVS